MEERIGIEIFNRERLPVVPTGAGKEFLLKAKEVIEKVDELVKPYKDPRHTKTHKFHHQ